MLFCLVVNYENLPNHNSSLLYYDGDKILQGSIAPVHTGTMNAKTLPKLVSRGDNKSVVLEFVRHFCGL